MFAMNDHTTKNCHETTRDQSADEKGRKTRSVQGSCCHTEPEPAKSSGCCDSGESSASKPRADWLLRICGSLVALFCLLGLVLPASSPEWLTSPSQSVLELMTTMAPGLVLAVIFVGLLSFVPRELVTGLLGKGNSVGGVFRATAAGVLLDLCSHGILMVGTKLYERGASVGQVMAFLIASPWNSLSLTIVMITLMGWGWTLTFLLASMLIGVISGLVFDRLCAGGILPMNPNQPEQDEQPKPLIPQFKELFASIQWNRQGAAKMVTMGLRESRMVFRWLFFGVLLAVAIRTFVPMETYQQLFGPTLGGLLLTLVAATIIEVCSEGSTPIAADLLTRAGAPGNSFTFLMAGVSTDYTEIMILRDATGGWKIPLFLPLITLPQILILGYLLNQF